MWKKGIVLLLVVSLMLAILSGCKKGDEELNSNDLVGVENNDGNGEQGEEKDTEEIENIDYVLYLTHEDLPYIYGEKFDITSNDASLVGKSIEEFVLEQLINFEKVENFITPIPQGTKLLGVEKRDGIVYVNLSKEFVDNMEKDRTSTEIAIASIVNTLTFFSDNSEVIIKVEGETIDNLNGVDMAEEFTFINDFVPNK